MTITSLANTEDEGKALIAIIPIHHGNPPENIAVLFRTITRHFIPKLTFSLPRYIREYAL